MDAEKFRAVYDESRNGANYFVRHPLVRMFQYSDGVKDLADLGCHWLLDIFATELPQAMRRAGEPHVYIEVKVADEAADMQAITEDGAEPIWRKHVSFTDMPTGIWNFELGDEGDRFALILLSEH